MISFLQAEQIHDILIKQFGGAKGIRDKSSLDAALSRPCQTFDSQQLYPAPNEKAASLIESILINHPFVDGNKRTGYVLMRLLLMEHKLDIKASEQEKYDFVLDIASGRSKYDHILKWLNDHTLKLEHI